MMQRLHSALLLALAASLLPLRAIADILPTETQPPQRPFTESMMDMVQRDLRWQREVELGLRPPPPRLIRIHEHKREGIKERPAGDSSVFFLPAVFLPPEEGTGLVREHRILAPQTKGASFAAISLSDQFAMGTGWIPPDTCGAIGPNHFLQVINGSVAVYTRTGTRLSHVTLNSFFSVTVGGTNYPRNYAFDPRVVYDRRSGRFFATTLEIHAGTNNHLILAVSRTSDPTGVWDKYVIFLGQSDKFSDFDTLGVDDNGVYIGANLFPSSGWEQHIAATRKASLIAASPYLDTVYFFRGVSGYYASPQPALNLDAVGPADPAWFVASSSSFLSDMRISHLTWPSSGAPTLSSVITLSLPSFDWPPNALQKGTSTNVDVGDMRMQPALVRNNRLYAVRTIGVNGTGGASGADRAAVEWVEVDVSSTSPSILQSGRLYDGSASDPIFFYYPSIAVNGLGHIAIAFSDSNGNRWIAAETAGRLPSDAPGTLQPIMQIVPGGASYVQLDGDGRNRWGDYSYTTVDPNDDLSLWTIQEYALATTNRWGTWVCQLLAPAPTLNNPGASAPAGTSGVVLNLTGTNIYDPGPGFPNRLNVVLTGGSPNGISNYVVTYLSSTSVQVQFDIASNASPGARDIVLTNPDGQQVTVVGGFTVQASTYPTTLSVADRGGSIGETVTLQATLTRSSDGSPVVGRTVSFTVAGSSAGSGVTNSSGVASVSYAIPESLGVGSASIGAAFAGDPPYEASSGSGTLTVSKATTNTAAANRSGSIGETVDLQATLTRTTDGVPLAGRTIAFTVEGSSAGSGVTNDSGVASVSYVIPEALGVGSAAVNVSFAGDALHEASSGAAELTVSKAATSTVAADRSGRIGETVMLSALLTRDTDSAGVSGRVVVFLLEGSIVGQGTTNASGVAETPCAIPEAAGAGSRSVQADFAGDGTYLPSSGTATLDVAKGDTNLTVEDAAGQLGAVVALKATLLCVHNGAPVAGRSVEFALDGSAVGSAATNDVGVAAVPYGIPPDASLGAHAIGAAFAGDAAYEPSTGGATLTVHKADVIVLAEDAAGSYGETIELAATLRRATDDTPLEGKTVAFSVEGTGVGDGSTSSSGRATIPYLLPEALERGDRSLQAAFAGDDRHNPGLDTAVLRVTGWPTSVTVTDVAGTVGTTVVLAATLVRADTMGPLDGRTIRFVAEGTPAAEATTNSTGEASAPYLIPDSIGSGSLTLQAFFDGDTAHEPSSGTGVLNVAKASTKMSVSDRSGTITEVVTLRGYLWRLDNTPIQGRPIAFQVDGTLVGSAATNTSGRADLNWTITEGPASRTITGTFAGDDAYTGSSSSGVLTCLSWTTKMATFDRTARITDRTELKCRLVRSDNAPLYNKTINFYVDGTFVIARPTNVQGYASYPFYDVPDGAGAGERTILSEWPGNGGYAAISRTAKLTVLKAIPYIWVMPRSVPKGQTARLYAYFRRLYDYQRQEGKTLTWRIDGTWIGDSVTGTTASGEPGVARFNYDTSGLSLGAHAVRCEFAGDAWVDAGYGEANLTIY